jgi:hypothetical protein
VAAAPEARVGAELPPWPLHAAADAMTIPSVTTVKDVLMEPRWKCEKGSASVASVRSADASDS